MVLEVSLLPGMVFYGSSELQSVISPKSERSRGQATPISGADAGCGAHLPRLLFQGSLEGSLPTLTLLGWKCCNLISPCWASLGPVWGSVSREGSLL